VVVVVVVVVVVFHVERGKSTLWSGLLNLPALPSLVSGLRGSGFLLYRPWGHRKPLAGVFHVKHS
jgi:hypothetical protein